MRRLHRPKRGDEMVDRGRIELDGAREERFTVHREAGGRQTVRVEALPSGDLWQLTLSPAGRPERIEHRRREGDAVFEATLTCFEDEVLIWRRGAEPISEQLAMPPGYRLLWPPVAGRGECLAGLESELDGEGRAAQIFMLLRLRPLDRGGLGARPVKLGLRVEPATNENEELRPGPARRIGLSTPGLRDMRAELDAAGRLLRWLEAEKVVGMRRPDPDAPSSPSSPDDRPSDARSDAEARPAAADASESSEGN